MIERARRRLVLPFLLPTLCIYSLLIFVPLALTLAYSFTNWQGHTLARPFFGLGNYRLLLMDPQVRTAFAHTVVFAAAGGFVVFGPALFFSWALSCSIRFKSVFRYLLIAPLVLSVVVVGLLWKLLYNPVFGPFDVALRAIGLDAWALPWLGDSRTALAAVILATAWHQLGMWVLLLSAGLERIPNELGEAARMDGASEWQVYRHVTLPLLWGILRLLFVLWIILSLQVFAQVWVMVPHGGAAGAAEVMATLIYKRAFASHQWGLACALATALMLVILVTSLVMERLTRRDTVEY